MKSDKKIEYPAKRLLIAYLGDSIFQNLAYRFPVNHVCVCEQAREIV
jgi:hypothetical protein